MTNYSLIVNTCGAIIYMYLHFITIFYTWHPKAIKQSVYSCRIPHDLLHKSVSSLSLLCHTEKNPKPSPNFRKQRWIESHLNPNIKHPWNKNTKACTCYSKQFSITNFLVMEVSICLLLPIQMQNATNSGVRARLHPLEMQYRGAVERFTQHFPLTIPILQTHSETFSSNTRSWNTTYN